MSASAGSAAGDALCVSSEPDAGLTDADADLASDADLARPNADPVEPDADTAESNADPLARGADTAEPDADPVRLGADAAEPGADGAADATDLNADPPEAEFTDADLTDNED